MKTNLMNAPEILVLQTGKFAPRKIWCNPEKSAEWFEAFTKELREDNEEARIPEELIEIFDKHGTIQDILMVLGKEKRAHILLAFYMGYLQRGLKILGDV